jgi:hypothetical protein
MCVKVRVYFMSKHGIFDTKVFPPELIFLYDIKIYINMREKVLDEEKLFSPSEAEFSQDDSGVKKFEKGLVE